MNGEIHVVVGAPVGRRGAYIINKFLSNQQEIQLEYPSCELVLATDEFDLLEELQHLMAFWELKGKVISYDTKKPDYARSRIWNIACGREAIRKYILTHTKAKYYLSVDTDMVYDTSIIKIMENLMDGYDILFSGCPMRASGTGLSGAGCMMVNGGTLERIQFRCIEFKNGMTLSEDNILEMDAFRLGCRIKKGFYVTNRHYLNEHEVKYLSPGPVGMLRKITNNSLLRYFLIRASIVLRCNIPLSLKALVNKLMHERW